MHDPVRDHVNRAEAFERRSERVGVDLGARRVGLVLAEDRVVGPEESQLDAARAGVDRQDSHHRPKFTVRGSPQRICRVRRMSRWSTGATVHPQRLDQAQGQR